MLNLKFILNVKLKFIHSQKFIEKKCQNISIFAYLSHIYINELFISRAKMFFTALKDI